MVRKIRETSFSETIGLVVSQADCGSYLQVGRELWAGELRPPALPLLAGLRPAAACPRLINTRVDIRDDIGVNIRVNIRVNFENGGRENPEKYFLKKIGRTEWIF